MSDAIDTPAVPSPPPLPPLPPLPSLLLIFAVSAIYYKIQRHFAVRSAFYGLRPVIAGLIVYAAILLAARNGLFSGFNWHTISLAIIFAASFWALRRLRLHPVLVILGSGLIGVALYS